MKVHTAKIVEVRNISDTGIVVIAACCDLVGPTLEMPMDPATGEPPEDTRSALTIHDIHTFTEADIRAQIGTHLANVEAKHMGKEIGKTIVQGLVGKTKAELGI